MSSSSWTHLVGSRLDRYDISARLSTGEITRVCLAHDSASGSDVVIKVIGYHADDHADYLSKYLRNWEAVQGIRHPNIVTIYRTGEGDSFAFVVMQYASGGTLRHLLREKSPLPVPDAACYMVQIAYALQYLHEQGIVHCDVKPANIFLECPGSSLALLADFGIARIPGAQAVTWSGSVIGTPCYRIARTAAVPVGHADERACVGFSQKSSRLLRCRYGGRLSTGATTRATT